MSVAARATPRGELLTLSEAAALAHVRRTTVGAWCASGRLPSSGGQRRGDRRVRRDDLERLVAERQATSRRVSESQPDHADVTPGSPASTRVASGHRNLLDRLSSGPADAPQLSAVFEEILDDAARQFGANRVGLWLWSQGREYPLKLAAAHEVPDAVIDHIRQLPAEAQTKGLAAVRAGTILIVRDSNDPSLSAEFRALYRLHGIASVGILPLLVRGEPQGLLVLYHDRPHPWDQEDLARAERFRDGAAIALGNARLVESVHHLAARLRAVEDLGRRLNGLQDVRGIGEAIVAEAASLIAYDTIRIYRVARETGWCEPIAFQGMFMGTADPTPDMLRVRIGTGLTGWVAEHNDALMVSDAQADGRSVVVGRAEGPESMLVVPMALEGEVRGVIVVSRLGRGQFGPDDQATLTIFAGYAAQALVNAERVEQLHRQAAELEHQLASQRRLMAVNEQLLSTLDPSGVLDLIADSLKAVVAYDTLTIYRIDTERNVRRPVIARDRFADVILGYEAPLGTGVTGWAVDHHEAVLVNDALSDPRAVQIPGTPSEPESLIVVPLIVEGEVLGTLNIGRMGEAESHFSANEFELTKLFSAQAAIALRNAEMHGEVKVQAERDALTSLRNHGSFQRELGATVLAGKGPFAVLMLDLDRFKAYNDTLGHPAGDELLRRVARSIEEAVRAEDTVYRYGGDEFAVILPRGNRAGAEEVAERIRAAIDGLVPESEGPGVSVSIGIACFPDDGADKDALVETADAALYVAKGSRRRIGSRDPFVAALDETAGDMLGESTPEDLLRAILARAARLLRTPHAYLYLLRPDGLTLEINAGLGLFESFLGYTMPLDRGVAGAVARSGKPMAVDDYDAFVGRSPGFDGQRVGAVLGVPLTSEGRVIGVIGLASGTAVRTWRDTDVEAVTRFAQLASIALQNARLRKAARREHEDPVTGLPVRDMLTRQIDATLDPALAASVDGSDSGRTETAAVILLDVDRFKVVNESLGHAAGDRVLREVGRRITAALGPGDMAARFGGDEFGILLVPAGAERAAAFADAILGDLRAPFELEGRTWFISASLGIALAQPGSASAGDLLREAEVALIQAQADPVTRVALFDPIRSREALDRLDLEADLRLALERDELIVHYQPIVDLRTERTVGFEALVRWQHPKRGLIEPAAFIQLAEATELIIPLGAQVLEKACLQARAWRDRWPGARLVMSVNLSPRQFDDPGLVSSIAEILRRTGLESSALELEITETAVMDRSEAGLRALADLRALGVRLVLDDFGTGYSSLAYLRHLPLDTIKIDRSFVTELDARDRNVAIVQAVLSLAHGLGINVVAEGIETSSQAARLRELGCDMGQGYAWARPQSAAGVERLLGAGPDQRLLPSNRSRNRKRLTKSR
ncbi:MAG: response regulator receiver modulated diguanylate cyclase/phosphodiesterase with sensor(s) [Chloroflexi bacterium]|nr:response regulator receiver modulated diguanylate cyclase/phosphodiesterase with sensor(s) [Chloroflexota bacterium]